MKGWTIENGVAYPTAQALGAMRNGTRVVKVRSQMADAHPDGATGTVVGSLRDSEVANNMVLYFVKWDTRPGVPVAVISWKLEAFDDRS